MSRLKGKSSFVVILGGLLWAAGAHADDRVLLLENVGQPSQALSTALGVQLIGVAELQVRGMPEVAVLPARIRAARELGQREDALLVVWAEKSVDLPDGTQEAVLYAVGQREGRALLEVVRVPGGLGPDMDRTLALKVREMVDELHRNQARTPSEAMLQPVRPPPPKPTAPSSAQGPRFGAELGLGGLAAVGGPPAGEPARWGAAATGGPVMLDEPLRLSARAELSWLPPVTAQRAGAQVRFGELVPALVLHGQLRQGPLWLGARTGFGLAFVDATGSTSSTGLSAHRTVRTALWLVGLELELPVAAGFGLLLGVELRARFRNQRFEVNGNEVVDLGRLRPLVGLALTWTTGRVR
jgi:hypothetical protein